eukprot:2044382-Prymnesium_polylepis.1
MRRKVACGSAAAQWTMAPKVEFKPPSTDCVALSISKPSGRGSVVLIAQKPESNCAQRELRKRFATFETIGSVPPIGCSVSCTTGLLSSTESGGTSEPLSSGTNSVHSGAHTSDQRIRAMRRSWIQTQLRFHCGMHSCSVVVARDAAAQ